MVADSTARHALSGVRECHVARSAEPPQGLLKTRGRDAMTAAVETHADMGESACRGHDADLPGVGATVASQRGQLRANDARQP